MLEQQTKPVYLQSVEDVFKEVQSSPSGLSSQEAASRLEKYGANTLQEGKKKSLLEKFVDQFKDFMILVLLVAAVVSMFAHQGEPDPTDAIIILAVVLLNAVLGVFQESKAEEAIEALKKMASPVASVLRDGHVEHIKGEDIVVGDVVILEAGDVVPADMRLFEVNTVKIEESALTGESVPVDKDLVIPSGDEVGIGDRTNMAFSSTNVTYGRAVGVVTSTGMNTEVGKIANMLANTEESKTPLQENQDALGKWLTIMILVIAVIIFVVGMLRGNEWTHMLLTAIAIAVAAIPEGLPAISTIILALGTQKMAQRNALVRKLPAVETLGGVEIICSDKTGTLTQNRLRTEAVFLNGEEVPVRQLKKYENFLFLETAVLANNAWGGLPEETSDPLEQALLEMTKEAGEEPEMIRKGWKRLLELPFDSKRKYMGTLCKKGREQVLFAKGAADVLLPRCAYVVNPVFSGKRRPESAEGTSWGWPMLFSDKNRILQQNAAWARKGMRVLALACRPLDERKAGEDLAENLIFLGLAAMSDPPRPQSRRAVAEAKKAGIRTVMITGDHKATAVAVAADIGIFVSGDLAVTGAELEQMDEQALERKLEQISVYARVSPEHKIRIVEAWQRKGHITAMTGDGVNDAPALKKADIGIAMGKSGTEVSRDAADMILTDDNFATIIKAVANGRNVYRNIKNAIGFLLSGNMAGILCVLYTSIKALPLPFAPVHLLFINLLTDSLPAIAIGMEPADKDLLCQLPRDPKEGILTCSFVANVLVQGVLIGGATMWAWEKG